MHPVHTENVNSGVGIADLLATAMTIPLILLWRTRRALWARVVCVALFVLALLTKEVTATVPALLLLGDFIAARRRQSAESEPQASALSVMRKALRDVLPLVFTAAWLAGLLVVYLHVRRRLSGIAMAVGERAGAHATQFVVMQTLTCRSRGAALH